MTTHQGQKHGLTDLTAEISTCLTWGRTSRQFMLFTLSRPTMCYPTLELTTRSPWKNIWVDWLTFMVQTLRVSCYCLSWQGSHQSPQDLAARLAWSFDETFFPLCTVDQRVYCNYNTDTVQELQATNQYVTLDQQAPSMATSDVWDPTLARMALQSNHLPPVGVDDAEASDSNVMSYDGSSE
eukprot:2418061-Rhodomonas_salina.1